MFRNLINQKYPNIKFKRKLKKNKNLRTMFPRGRRKVPFKQLSFIFFLSKKNTQNVHSLGFVFEDFSAFGKSEILM